MLRIGSIVIRVDDLDREVAFWTAALDYVPRPGDADDFVDYVILADPEGNRFCVIDVRGGRPAPA